jgi:hypothetical protein
MIDIKPLLRRPIAFQTVFVDVTGTVNAGLMLSQAYYWAEVVLRTMPERKGWFYKTREEWFAETRLSRREQETARKILRTTTFWEERIRGVPAKLYFRINLQKLTSAILKLAQNEPTSFKSPAVGTKGTAKPVRQVASKLVQNEPTITKTTKDIQKTPAPSGARGTLPAAGKPRQTRFSNECETAALREYRDQMTSHGLTADIDATDRHNLRFFLHRHPEVTEAAFRTTLGNAFAAASPYGSLHPGFRLREFLSHYAKYERPPDTEKSSGNLQRAVSGRDSTTELRPGERWVQDGRYKRLVRD